MTTTEQIPKTYEEAVKTLARWQGEGGEPDLKIYVFPDPEKKVVRLLDVSDGFADRGGIPIYKMGASEELPFRSAIALAVPRYFEKLLSGEKLLPPEWDVSLCTQVWPDEGA